MLKFQFPVKKVNIKVGNRMHQMFLDFGVWGHIPTYSKHIQVCSINLQDNTETKRLVFSSET